MNPADCAQMFPSWPQMTACLTILVATNWSSTYDCHDMLLLLLSVLQRSLARSRRLRGTMAEREEETEVVSTSAKEEEGEGG